MKDEQRKPGKKRKVWKGSYEEGAEWGHQKKDVKVSNFLYKGAETKGDKGKKLRQTTIIPVILTEPCKENTKEIVVYKSDSGTEEEKRSEFEENKPVGSTSKITKSMPSNDIEMREIEDRQRGTKRKLFRQAARLKLERAARKAEQEWNKMRRANLAMV